MGANEKLQAAMHGAEYTPRLSHVRAGYVRTTSGAVGLAEAEAQFARWLEQVRAEAKAEAWDEVANAFQYKAWVELIQGNMQTRLRIAQPITEWLRARANRYKEGK